MLRKMVWVLALLASIAASFPGFAASAGKHPGKPMTAKLLLKGMHCEGCAQSVTSNLTKTPGVKTAKVDFKTKAATVTYDPAKCSPSKLVEAVKKSGYAATLAK